LDLSFQHIISIINNPRPARLQNCPDLERARQRRRHLYRFLDGKSDAQFYRIKWGANRIVDWIGFDSGSNVLAGDPVSTMPWLAAKNAAGIRIPAPGMQSMTIATGMTHLKPSQFERQSHGAFRPA